MIHQCSNGRRIIVSNMDELISAITDQVTPCVALFPAWRHEQVEVSYWEGVVRFLLDRGCTYFVCAGVYSEELHDAVDDFLYQYDDELGVEKSIGVVTTYHADESIEDVVNFFVHSTVIWDKAKGCMVAILDASDSEEMKVIRCLAAS